MSNNKAVMAVAALTLGVFVAGAISPAMAHGSRGGAGGGERPDFSTLDSNGDGQLTQEELQAPALARFAEADANGDGVLSLDELTARAEDKGREVRQKRLERMIERSDANGDGALSFEEMTAPQVPLTMFERIDEDGDGVISQAEFDAAKKMGRKMRKGGGHRHSDEG